MVAQEGSVLPGARELNGSIEPFTHSTFTEFGLFVYFALGTGQRAVAQSVVLLPQTGAWGPLEGSLEDRKPRERMKALRTASSLLSALLFE